MTRQCERPDCAVRASVAYGFDARRRMAWFATLSVLPGDEAMAGALCAAHARAMVLPRGWWLDDRRDPSTDRLFVTSSGAEADRADHIAPPARPERPRRTRRRAQVTPAWVEVPLPLDVGAAPVRVDLDGAAPTSADGATDGTSADGATDEPAADEPAADEPAADDVPARPGPAADDDRVVVPWRPRFDQSDDLDGVLAARSPLLARAFGGMRRSAPRPPRSD